MLLKVSSKEDTRSNILDIVQIFRAKVVDVSALGKVHNLDLSGTEVTDVSALGKVHTLNLYGTKVTDISALGMVHTSNHGSKRLNAPGSWLELRARASRLSIFESSPQSPR